MYLKILIGMGLGVLFGLLFYVLHLENIVTYWIKPFGTIFIKALKMVTVPLVLVSLLKGVLGLKSIKELSTMGLRTISIYLTTTLIAVIVGISAVSIIKPGELFPKEKSEQLLNSYKSNSERIEAAKSTSEKNEPLSFLVDIVPDNIAVAMSDNSKILQIIFLATLFGIAILHIGIDKLQPLVNVIDSIDQVILKSIEYIMKYAPIGVFAIMASLFIDTSGDSEVFASLGLYAATVIGGLAILTFGVYPLLIHLFTDIKVKKFLKAVIPVQLVAFSTSSSASTLPVTMEQCEKELKLPNKVTSFVLPVGVTINMDGTSCYQAVSIIFIAQVVGIDLSFLQIVSIILLSIISSVGTPGIPGASIVMTVMILTSVGIPSEGLVLILAIDRPLDMLRTVVNVTGDVAVASIVNKGVSKQENERLQE